MMLSKTFPLETCAATDRDVRLEGRGDGLVLDAIPIITGEPEVLPNRHPPFFRVAQPPILMREELRDEVPEVL